MPFIVHRTLAVFRWHDSPVFTRYFFSALLSVMFHERTTIEMPAIEKSSLPKLTSEDFFTSKEVADLLHISPRTLERYRSEESGLLYIDVNHKIKLYPKLALYQWMAKRVRKSTSDPGVMVSRISEALESSATFFLPASSVMESPQRKRGRPRALPPASSPQESVSHITLNNRKEPSHDDSTL